MKLPTMNKLVWFLIIILWISGLESADYFMIEKIHMCEDVPEQQVQIYMTLQTFTSRRQTVDLNITSSKQIGENSFLKCLIYMDVNHQWLQVSTFQGDFCHTFKMYVGQLFYDLERGMGILPGTCPIPKGIYHAVNHTFDYEKLTLQPFLAGRMKFRVETHDRNKQIMNSCVIVISKNHD